VLPGTLDPRRGGPPEMTPPVTTRAVSEPVRVVPHGILSAGRVTWVWWVEWVRRFPPYLPDPRDLLDLTRCVFPLLSDTLLVPEDQDLRQGELV
jgi:hypothetical protein